MTSKQFRWAKIAIAFVLAVVVGQAVIINSYILAMVAVLIAALLIVLIQRQVKEVLADERDYKIAGDTARWTLAIVAVLGWLVSFVMIALRNVNPSYETAGFTLAYATCALLIIHMTVSLFFRRVNDGTSRGKRAGYFLLALLAALLIVIAGLRVFSGEDDWICQNGQWIKHGNPSAPMPVKACK
jgi:uncharacterized membrane protein